MLVEEESCIQLRPVLGVGQTATSPLLPPLHARHKRGPVLVWEHSQQKYGKFLRLFHSGYKKRNLQREIQIREALGSILSLANSAGTSTCDADQTPFKCDPGNLKHLSRRSTPAFQSKQLVGYLLSVLVATLKLANQEERVKSPSP